MKFSIFQSKNQIEFKLSCYRPRIRVIQLFCRRTKSSGVSLSKMIQDMSGQKGGKEEFKVRRFERLNVVHGFRCDG